MNSAQMTSMHTSTETISILLVEDDEVDIEAVRRTFKAAALNNTLHVAGDGKQALDMLRADSPRQIEQPCLILLDINMPGMNGLEFLRERASDLRLMSNPLFVLTTSDLSNDKVRAFAAGANAYILKKDLKVLPAFITDYVGSTHFVAP